MAKFSAVCRGKNYAVEQNRSALEDICQGEMVVLVDDEDRGNEGDLVMAAEFISPEAVNFMAREGRVWFVCP